MKLRYLLMFIGCILGGIGGLAYVYVNACTDGSCETGSSVLYGIFIGLFFADLLSIGVSGKET